MNVRSPTSTNILLLVLFAVILAIIALQWLNPPRLQLEATASVSTAADQLTAVDSQAPLNIALAPLENYQEIVERPLFFATRRPAPPEPEETAAPADPVSEGDVAMTLIGVVKTPEAEIALVQNDETGKVARLRVGEKIASWQLEQVDANRVVLRKGDQIRELALLRNQRKPTQQTTRQVEALRKRQRLLEQQRQAQAEAQAGNQQQSSAETADQQQQQEELEQNEANEQLETPDEAETNSEAADDNGLREEPTNGVPTKGAVNKINTKQEG